MEQQEFQLRVDANVDNVPVIAGFLEDAMQRCGVEASKMFDVNVAVDEACTNIIQHAYPSGTGPIDISCHKSGNKFVVMIKDYGRPFDQTGIPDPDLTSPVDERKPGGLGVYMMRKLMDELYYEYKDGSEILTMVKYV